MSDDVAFVALKRALERSPLSELCKVYEMMEVEEDMTALFAVFSVEDLMALFTIKGLFTLMMLVVLQAVLGFDNLLYISIESKRVPEDKQSYVRRLGLGVAIALRLVLLFVLVLAVEHIKGTWIKLPWKKFVYAEFSFRSLIVLFGGGFILYTAIKEIFHMLSIDELGEGSHDKKRSVNQAIFWIVLMNLVFSFDSILSAMALTKNFWVMAVAIIASGLMMIFLSDAVAAFLQRNRMYEVLGLFVLFLVGVMLVGEGGHLAHLTLFGYEVHGMPQSTFYFVLFVMVIVEVVQGRYQKKLMMSREKDAEILAQVKKGDLKVVPAAASASGSTVSSPVNKTKAAPPQPKKRKKKKRKKKK